MFFNTSSIAFIEAQTRNSICGSDGLLSQEFYLVNRVSAEGLIEPKSPHNTSHQNRLPKADLETALYCGSCCTRGHPAETLEKRGLTTSWWLPRRKHLYPLESWTSEQLVDALDLVPYMSDNNVEKQVWLCCLLGLLAVKSCRAVGKYAIDK